MLPDSQDARMPTSHWHPGRGSASMGSLAFNFPSRSIWKCTVSLSKLCSDSWGSFFSMFLCFSKKSRAFYAIFWWFEKMGIPTLGWHNWNLSRRRGVYPRRGETRGGLTTLAGQDQSCRLKLLERKEGVRYWWSLRTGGIWISWLVRSSYYNT